MTTELWMLTWSAVLAMLAPLVYLTGRAVTPGAIAWAAGNRDEPFVVPAWVSRAQRAHANLLENLLPFAALVLVCHVGNRSGALSALGATLFFWGRVAHHVVYCVGIPYLRTAIFFVAQTGLLLVLLQILRG
jgi:uncharacterized MAPEG superfamily protein